MNLDKLTPMMQKYIETKEENKDCILFYRLGDFYEMFFDDAITASRELEITLTGKNCGLEDRAAMCGIPYHAVDTYLNKLVELGYKVAICEQVEDPKLAKGIVKREVVRVVTPGTNLSIQALDEKVNNYLMCVVYESDGYGISICDVSTGDYSVTEACDIRSLLDEIVMYSPVEIIGNSALEISGVDLEDLRNRLGIKIYILDGHYFGDFETREVLMKHFHTKSLSGLGLGDFTNGVLAAGALLTYLYETQKTSLSHLTSIHPYLSGKFMMLDSSTRRNLELVETLREKNKTGSLLWVLDKTKTAMGARLLRNYVEQPLVSIDEISARQDAVESLINDMVTREELREYLQPIYDLERLVSRVTYETANPKDLLSFRGSLEMLPYIKGLIQEYDDPLMKKISQELDPLEDLFKEIDMAISEDAPLTVRDGGIFKDGYEEEIDRLRSIKTDGKRWLAKLEHEEREKTGIKSMRVKYNRVFGYYLEVTNSFKDQVPPYYIRKQTLSNAERYIIPELKELEDNILGADDKLVSLEYDKFCELRKKIAGEVIRIHKTAKAVAQIDVLASFAHVAQHNNYVRPKMNGKGVINIVGGRHPVVERMIKNDLFIENDTYLDNNKKRISIITGPNMAGKSTYMRQSALIVLMAQIGCFVPAKAATIGIVDRIFTRVGASDDLASGQSTFMVEMTEVANILRNATKNSLLILDEIGRGTSTYDGLSIAWAVVEYISNPKLLGAKTLFATHYHELTELEGKLDNVNNYCIAVKENGDDIVFLRKIIKGGADKSYGILVAKLAGVPDPVIDRAKEIATQLSLNDLAASTKSILPRNPSKIDKHVEIENQISIFSLAKEQDNEKKNKIKEDILALDVSNFTPIEALNKIAKWQEIFKN